jgi:hypothetical protein
MHIPDDAMLLNHLSVRYRPGDKAATAKAFELLGCGVRWVEGMDVLLVRVDHRDTSETYVNRVAAWPMSEEQLRIERYLDGARQTPEGAALFADYARMSGEDPDRVGHFGIRLASTEQLETIVARIDAVDDPDLVGRIRINGRCNPNDGKSHAVMLKQAFVWTDLFAPGLINGGAHFELQAEV